MRKSLFVTLLLGCILISGLSAGAQIDIDKQLRERILAPDSLLNDDTDADRHGTLQSYYLSSRSGDLRSAPLDTLKLNSFRRGHIEGKSIAESYMGTYAGPYQSKIYFDQPIDRWGEFFYLAPYFHLYRRGQMARYFDTKVPYTYMSIQKLGSSDNLEQIFQTLFTSNLGPSVNIGGEAEIDKANGVYNNTASQALTYRIFGSYTKQRYELLAEVGNTNVINQENGGITDTRYITDVEEIAGGRRTILPRDIPTRYKSTWNAAGYGRGRLHHKYRFGFYREYDAHGNLVKESDAGSLGKEVAKQGVLQGDSVSTQEPSLPTDSLTAEPSLPTDSLSVPDDVSTVASDAPIRRSQSLRRSTKNPDDSSQDEEMPQEEKTTRVFVPVTAIFHDFTLQRGSHEFVSQDPNLQKRYDEPFIPRREGMKYYPYDRFRSMDISNTVGVDLIEGFHKWAKMSISAFASFDYQTTHQPLILPEDAERLDLPYEEMSSDLHSTLVGGRVKSDSFDHLKWYVQGHVGVEGYRAGEVDVRGNVDLSMKLFGKDVNLRAQGIFLNEVPPYLLEHFMSTYHAWDRELKNTQRVRLEGELEVPFTRTHLFVRAETMQNPYAVDSVSQEPYQHEGNVSLLSAGFDQTLKWRFINLETSFVWQKTSNDYVTPLPEFAAHGNFYLSTMIAKVMTLQVGVDAKWHSSYHAPYYEPTTQMFTPQSEIIIGGDTPMLTAYANFHLKRARAFVRYYNVGSLLFKPNHFSMPYYPTYPAQIQLGVVVDLKN